jgi:hypothetical protein
VRKKRTEFVCSFSLNLLSIFRFASNVLTLFSFILHVRFHLKDMQRERAAWTCNMETHVQHGQTAWLCCMDMQHERAASPHSMDVQHMCAAWTCSMGMHHFFSFAFFLCTKEHFYIFFVQYLGVTVGIEPAT